MKRLLLSIASMLRALANGIENRKENDNGDLMADVDDQRAHHFGIPKDFDELSQLSQKGYMKSFLRNQMKLLNLNAYEWWRNHRRFITLGIFLALFAAYVRIPSADDFKVRDTCGRLQSSYQITSEEAMKKLNLKPFEDYDKRSIANNYCERYLGIK